MSSMNNKTNSRVNTYSTSSTSSTSSTTSTSSSSYPQTPSHLTTHLQHTLHQSRSSNPEIIKSIKSYKATHSLEISFQSGDAFSFLGQRSDQAGHLWFEACHLKSGARGLVPSTCFESLHQEVLKTSHHQSTPSWSATNSPTSPTRIISSSQPKVNHQHATAASLASSRAYQKNPLFGTVKYDFTAERTDELDAKRGESLVIMAHSESQWFVVKPIGRLGGPGLIPLNFVEVKDMVSGHPLRLKDLKEVILKKGVPDIDAWKASTAAYKVNSISLGTFDNLSNRGGVVQSGATELKGSKKPISLPQPARAALLPARSHGNLKAPSTPTRPFTFSSVTSLPLATQLVVPLNPISLNPSSIHSNKRSSDQHPSQREPINSKDFPLPPGRSTPTPSPAKSIHSQEQHFATVGMLRDRYGTLVHASVESFHQESGQYWFHLRSHFKKANSKDETVLVLYRLYDQFLEFYSSLSNDVLIKSRSPAKFEPDLKVDELVCCRRMEELNEFFKELEGFDEVVRSKGIIYEFLGPREGDVELQKTLNSKRRSNEKVKDVKEGSKSRGSSSHRRIGSTLPSTNPSQALNSNFYRIKVYQEKSSDVFALRIQEGMKYKELIEKIEERVEGGQNGLVKIKDGKDSWREIRDEVELADWFGEGEKLVLMYCC
ncbi:uncharacterized protein MELLADRAFT_116922 [Melampsora larici-populina 98AG31]|uniref:SH3 domain-containing protein n=1 Tax=Melampsora larici-populina (strain 98AG31 / pathotype 3-4-7) TaxID=747676 RepID=F4RRD7_MELLP|nr:uncharacterized protein MELLADRAFT_116922 [Melampsora larici-populina 98AG31]EGG04919.1 hypothetical protein MELLADRAFT_116922 [Melampsora larici-populina 98AG31]